MRIDQPLGVYQTGYLPWTNKTGTLTKRQRWCPECGARPYHGCQRAYADRDGVTRWAPIKRYHQGR